MKGRGKGGRGREEKVEGKEEGYTENHRDKERATEIILNLPLWSSLLLCGSLCNPLPPFLPLNP